MRSSRYHRGSFCIVYIAKCKGPFHIGVKCMKFNSAYLTQLVKVDLICHGSFIERKGLKLLMSNTSITVDATAEVFWIEL